MIQFDQIPESEAQYRAVQVAVGGQQVYPTYARVSAMPYNTVWPGRQRPLDQTEDAGFVLMQADEPFEMTVTYDHMVEEVIVRPLSKAIRVQCQGHVARFTLPGPGQYSVEADGPHHALAVFVNPPGRFGVDLEDPSVVYYGPGVHHAGQIVLKSEQTLYLEAGAVVYGSVTAIGAQHVTIAGHGILDGSLETRENEDYLYPVATAGPDVSSDDNKSATAYLHPVSQACLPEDAAGMQAHLKAQRVLHGCIRFYHCKDIRVLGVTLRDSASFALIPANCVGIHIAYVKTIGMWRYNADGIDLINSSDALIEDCYLRNFDDCMVLKGVKGFDRRNVARIVMRRLTVWCDWGRALEIGAETCADAYHDILFEDCDLIHGAHMMMDIQNGDRARIYDVIFRNIRCEFSGEDMPCVYQSDMDEPYKQAAARVVPVTSTNGFDPEHMEYGLLMKSHNYCGVFSKDGKMGGVKGVRFEQIQVYLQKDAPMPPSRFEGVDSEHMTENVKIINLKVNGKRLASLDEACVTCTDYTRNITIQ